MGILSATVNTWIPCRYKGNQLLRDLRRWECRVGPSSPLSPVPPVLQFGSSHKDLAEAATTGVYHLPWLTVVFVGAYCGF